MTLAPTNRKQRMISIEDMQSPEFQAVPDEAKSTAMGLWTLLDVWGRGPLDEWWIAGELYPSRDPVSAADMVESHLILLMECGFMSTYRAQGFEWIELVRPLKADPRRAQPLAPSDSHPWTPSMAVERERARARAREVVQAESEARAEAWAAVAADRVRPERPERPAVLDAPPIGCPKHPDGLVEAPCGPCGTAREQRRLWLTKRVYEDRMTHFYEQGGDDDEPF